MNLYLNFINNKLIVPYLKPSLHRSYWPPDWPSVVQIEFSLVGSSFRVCWKTESLSKNKYSTISYLLVALLLHMKWFPDIVMKNFALRIFNISDANERQNQVPLGCTIIHAIFLLTVRRIRIFFSLKPSLFQGKSSLKISACWGSLFWRS